MGTRDTAQAFTIIGIIYNILVVLIQGTFFFFGPSIIHPFTFSLLGGFWFLLALILPIIAYREIDRGEHSVAGALLIISGLYSLVYNFLFGGVFLIIAGILMAVYREVDC